VRTAALGTTVTRLFSPREHLGDGLRERRGGRAKEQHVLSAQEGLSAFCVEVDVNDRGAFLLAKHDERDSLSRPYGEGNGLV